MSKQESGKSDAAYDRDDFKRHFNLLFELQRMAQEFYRKYKESRSDIASDLMSAHTCADLELWEYFQEQLTIIAGDVARMVSTRRTEIAEAEEANE